MTELSLFSWGPFFWEKNILIQFKCIFALYCFLFELKKPSLLEDMIIIVNVALDCIKRVFLKEDGQRFLWLNIVEKYKYGNILFSKTSNIHFKESEKSWI